MIRGKKGDELLFHAAVFVGGILLSIKWGKWKRWKEFLPTYYYWALFSCYYEYISYIGNKQLWEFQKNFISLFVTESLYAFLLYPCLIVVFLGNFPEIRNKKILYLAKWTFFSLIFETAAYYTGSIKFYNGWSLVWDIFFYGTMYPMIRFHQKAPIPALILSFGFVLFYLIVFQYHVF